MFDKSDLLSEILKQYVVKEAIVTQADRTFVKKNLYPSSDFYCATKAYRDIKFSQSNKDIGYFLDERDYSYEGERAKYVGNAFHTYLLGDEKTHVRGVIEKAGILITKELPMKDEENHISSRLDAIVKIREKLYIVELKSAKSYAIMEYSKECAPSKMHQEQLQLYFHLYEMHRHEPEIKALTGGEPITSGIILYEGKNDHKFLEFAVKKNQKMIDGLLEYSRRVFGAAKKGKEPIHVLEPEDFECRYMCKSKYFVMCHGKEKNEKVEAEKIIDLNTWGFAEVKGLNKEPKF